MLALVCVLVALAVSTPAQAAGQQKRPQAVPTTRIPYEYNEEAPPRTIGAILGVGLLLVIIGGVSYGIRRKNIRERARRWRSALPESVVDPDPWIERDALTEGRALVRDLDAAWAADDQETLRRIVSPGLLARWRSVRSDGPHRRIDEFAPIRVDFVTVIHPAPDEEARVVVRVEARVRDIDDRMPSTVKGRIAARAGGKGGDRGMSPAEGRI